MKKGGQKKFYPIEEIEYEDLKKSSFLPSQYRCFLNCFGRIDKKKYKTVSSSPGHPPTVPAGSFPVVTLANNKPKRSSTLNIDDQDLLNAFQKETNFDVSNWIMEGIQDTGVNDDMSDFFSVGPVDIDSESVAYTDVEICLRRQSHYSSLHGEMGYITEDESVSTLENVLLQEVPSWVPFDCVSFSPTRKHKSAQKSSSPRTPTMKNSQVESHGTPATEITDDSHSNCESISEGMEDVLVSVPTLSGLDCEEIGEENDSFHHGYCDDGSLYDFSLSNGSEFTEDTLSELHNTNTVEVLQRTRKALEKDHIVVHSPPNPNRHRQEIDRFFLRNETSQSFDMDLLKEGEDYLMGFNPYTRSIEKHYSDSNSSCLSHDENGSYPNEKVQRHRFEDIGSHNYEFDALYHSSVSSM